MAETSRGRGKGASRKLAAAALALSAAFTQAAPEGGQVVGGAAASLSRVRPPPSISPPRTSHSPGKASTLRRPRRSTSCSSRRQHALDLGKRLVAAHALGAVHLARSQERAQTYRCRAASLMTDSSRMWKANRCVLKLSSVACLRLNSHQFIEVPLPAFPGARGEGASPEKSLACYLARQHTQRSTECVRARTRASSRAGWRSTMPTSVESARAARLGAARRK